MDVGVGDVGSDNFKKSARAKDGFHALHDLFYGSKEGEIIFVFEVVEFVDWGFRDDKGVAGRFWVYVEEGKSFFVFVDFIARDFPVDDFFEDSHGVIVARGQSLGRENYTYCAICIVLSIVNVYILVDMYRFWWEMYILRRGRFCGRIRGDWAVAKW